MSEPVVRDYGWMDVCLDHLAGDIYPQPPDDGHTFMASQILCKWLPSIDLPSHVILDVGCGQGFCKPVVEGLGWSWVGVTRGTDYGICVRNGMVPVHDADMSFLPFPSGAFDMVFARHVLEHSPMPLLTLMEWYRVAKFYILLVCPAIDSVIATGRNHYSILSRTQLLAILPTAHLQVVWSDDTEPREYRWLLRKLPFEEGDHHVIQG